VHHQNPSACEILRERLEFGREFPAAKLFVVGRVWVENL
jgi:hypothetical protein